MLGKLILLVGKAAAGKSHSLKWLKDPEKVAYMNCESAKYLPFRSKFKEQIITDPKSQLIGKGNLLDMIAAHPEKFHTVVIDTLTALMDLFETKYVKTATNTQQAWGDYSDFFINLMNQKVPELVKAGINVIILAHTADRVNEENFTLDTIVPVKGAIGKRGVEAFFNDIVACKKLTISSLEGELKDRANSPMLNITDNERDLGYKHVIQTRLTKDTVNERIRSPEDLWAINETFIDGNIQTVLDRMDEFYNN